MTHAHTKSEIRTALLAQRKNEPLAEIGRKSETIQKSITSLSRFKTASTILCYYPIHQEVDIRPLIAEWLSDKTILLPRITGETLTLHPIHSLEELVEGAYGTKEPEKLHSFQPHTAIDLALIPGIAFDPQGNRIGFGKGYYDRMLHTFTCPKIGLAYEFQIVENIPAEAHDEKVEMIITEQRTISITPLS